MGTPAQVLRVVEPVVAVSINLAAAYLCDRFDPGAATTSALVLGLAEAFGGAGRATPRLNVRTVYQEV